MVIFWEDESDRDGEFTGTSVSVPRGSRASSLGHLARRCRCPALSRQVEMAFLAAAREGLWGHAHPSATPRMARSQRARWAPGRREAGARSCGKKSPGLPVASRESYPNTFKRDADSPRTRRLARVRARMVSANWDNPYRVRAMRGPGYRSPIHRIDPVSWLTNRESGTQAGLAARQPSRATQELIGEWLLSAGCSP